jgi:hypothetical protein
LSLLLTNGTSAKLGLTLHTGDLTMTIMDLVGSPPAGFRNGTDRWYAQLVAANPATVPSILEYLVVTSISGSVYTIQRAQEGSTAITAPAGTPVTFRLTTGCLAELIGETAFTVTGFTLTPMAQIGPPATGVWAAGQLIVDAASNLWICVTAPGSSTSQWSLLGGSDDSPV